MTYKRFIIPLGALCVTTFGCHSAGPDAAAREYEQRRVAGDLAQIPPLILPTEAQELSSNRTSLSDAGLTEMGLPSATVDSARVHQAAGDSALVYVYMTGPNTRAVMGDLFTRAMSGQLDTSATGVRKALASAPRITVIDTVSLMKVGRDWKVSLRLMDRHAAKLASKQLHEAYRDDDLSAAVAAAKSLLDVHAKAPGVVDDDDVLKARDVIASRVLTDSIEANLVIERGFLGASLRGYVRNLSGSRLVDVVLRVRDTNGETRKVSVHRLNPGDRETVFELAGSLATGKPASVNVAWINLGAWESLGF